MKRGFAITRALLLAAMMLAPLAAGAIDNYGPTPDHIYSEFPIGYTTATPLPNYEPPESPDITQPPGKTPPPGYTVDAPRTKPPDMLYGLADDILQTLDGFQYTLDASGNATIVGFADKSLADVIIPSQIGGHPVTAIGDIAFDGHPGMKTVSIPDSVVSIGIGAFANCKRLSQVTLPDSVTQLREFAFASCDSLREVRLSKNLKAIPESLFTKCVSLEAINIPAGVTSIGISAFGECRSLKEVTIPDTVTMIGEVAFAQCDKLESVTIPEGMQSIGYGAFANCMKLKSITLPQSLHNIGMNILDLSGKAVASVYENSAAHDYAKANGIPFILIKETLQEKKKEAEAAAVTGTEGDVIFYAEKDGQGVSATLHVGDFARNFTNAGFENDQLSSVRIRARGVIVQLYMHTNYQGTCLTLANPGLYNLEDYDFDNTCSSFIIVK